MVKIGLIPPAPKPLLKVFMNTLSRRSFLVANAGLMTIGKVAIAQNEFPPIIDTHQHLWDRTKIQLDWIEKGSVLDRDFLPSDYAKATAGLGVVQSVYMEVDVTPTQQTLEANEITALCKSKSGPTRSAIISGRPASPDFSKYLDQFRDNPYIKGIRQVLHASTTPAGYSLSPEFKQGIQELGKRGLSFDICLRSVDLEDGVKLAQACPDTRFILDHCGNPNVKQAPDMKWLKAIESLAKLPNVSGKISGIIAGSDPTKPLVAQLAPFVNHMWDSFGPDKVVFGGDWPVCLLGGSYSKWVQTLREIVSSRSKVDQQKLFHDNALRVYKL